ncbi:MAG: GDP-fucose synthetase [Methylotenera sp.]|jgi:GDP-L-fucose synthase|nr:MAG: GDP-fucose synthetase [Methylotenera sp.]
MTYTRKIEMQKDSRILITGSSGLLGTALTMKLKEYGYTSCITPSSQELNLLSYENTLKAFCDTYRPEYVFHLAGAVYGIGGNLKKSNRIFLENTLINTHVVEASFQAGVKKIIAMGSICAYPTPYPFDGSLIEDFIFHGIPHFAERAYGQSKRAMLAQLESYTTQELDHAFVISSNLYGPNDHFNLETGHVIPSLIRKFYEAQQYKHDVQIWGDGLSRRDIMHSWDAADALIKVMLEFSGRINLASGNMLSIADIVSILGDISGVKNWYFDESKPKGHEFPGINIDQLNSINYSPNFDAKKGLEQAYHWYCDNANFARK